MALHCLARATGTTVCVVEAPTSTGVYAGCLKSYQEVMKWTACFDYDGENDLKDSDAHVVYLIRADERFVPMGKL